MYKYEISKGEAGISFPVIAEFKNRECLIAMLFCSPEFAPNANQIKKLKLAVLLGGGEEMSNGNAPERVRASSAVRHSCLPMAERPFWSVAPIPRQTKRNAARCRARCACLRRRDSNLLYKFPCGARLCLRRQADCPIADRCANPCSLLRPPGALAGVARASSVRVRTATFQQKQERQAVCLPFLFVRAT